MKEKKISNEYLITVSVAFFLASLIRIEFLTVFSFFIGFTLAQINKTETWIKIK
jgi:hypothetical protein